MRKYEFIFLLLLGFLLYGCSDFKEPTAKISNVEVVASSVTFDLKITDIEDSLTDLFVILESDDRRIKELTLQDGILINELNKELVFDDLRQNTEYYIKVIVDYKNHEHEYSQQLLADYNFTSGTWGGAINPISSLAAAFTNILIKEETVSFSVNIVDDNYVLSNIRVELLNGDGVLDTYNQGDGIGIGNNGNLLFTGLTSEQSYTIRVIANINENDDVMLALMDISMLENVNVRDIQANEKYYNPGDNMIVTFTFDKLQNYSIDSITFGNIKYTREEFVTSTENEISIEINASNDNGVNDYDLTNITYSYSGLAKSIDIEQRFHYFVGDTSNIHYIYTATDLQNVNSNGINILMNNIDLIGIKWTPLTLSQNGYFDGNGYIINHLTIEEEINDSTFTFWGLFDVNNGWIQNVRLDNINIELFNHNDIGGSASVGALAGKNESIIKNVSVTGDISGNGKTGGLVGVNVYGAIFNSHTIVNINGAGKYTGGLVGMNQSTIIHSSVAGNVIGSIWNIGGLAGYSNGTIIKSYSSADVDGADGDYVGGLVGRHFGTIENSYAAGDITGNGYFVGGLVGVNASTIMNSYARGNVSGLYSGGLVGRSWYGIVINSYRYVNQNIICISGESKAPTIQVVSDAELTDINWFKNTLGFDDKIWDLSFIEEDNNPILK